MAIESVIDVCAMIVSSERLGMPSNEDSIIDILVEKNVLDKEFGERLKDMKGFRNILIHRYAHLNDRIVYSNLTDYLDDFSKFNRTIQSYIKRFSI